MRTEPIKKYIHKTLKDKIKTVVKDDKDVNRICDYLYWEVSKLVEPSKDPRYLAGRVERLLDYLKHRI